MQERLQKVLAAAGIASRRMSETWIKDGRVKVDGVVVTELGTKVDPSVQKIVVDGRVIKPPARRYYIALNKPRHVVCSLADSHAARLVTEFVDIQGNPMLRPVGRLDADSEGLIFLSDDGDFIYKMTHPKYHIPKTYKATVRGVPDDVALRRLATGIMLEDGMTAPAKDVGVGHVRRDPEGGEGQSDVFLTIFEGRNRQVRRMMAAVGHPVSRLTRISIGPVKLSHLPPGAWRHLSDKEIAALTSDPETPSKETEKPWQTEQPPSTQPKAPSSSASLRTSRPLRPRTSSASRKRGSTTD